MFQWSHKLFLCKTARCTTSMKTLGVCKSLPSVLYSDFHLQRFRQLFKCLYLAFDLGDPSMLRGLGDLPRRLAEYTTASESKLLRNVWYVSAARTNKTK